VADQFQSISRRDFVAGTGALIVGFGTTSHLADDAARAQAPAAAPPAASPSLAKAPQLDSWIKIGGAGDVTVLTGKVEIGQGIKTALMQIVADELDVDLQRIRVVTADTEQTPDESTTSRSHSIIESGGALRAAAAQARAFLLAKAAERLRIPVDALSVSDGTISPAAGGETVTYWSIIGDNNFNQAITGNVKAKDPAAYKYVGKSIARVDIPGKVTGAPAFVQDLRLPGMLHGRIVRPPIDRADVKLASSDTKRAAAMPGVVKVVQDGRFLGVIAAREEQAIAAADALRQDTKWDLPVLPPQAQLKEQLPTLPAKDRVLRNEGNVAEALAQAQHRVEATYFVPFQSHGSIGPSCAVAQVVDGTLTVWTHSQAVFSLRTDLANVLGKPEKDVHLIHMEGSACYGQNGADDVPLDAAVLALAVPGRPVRVQWMRADEFAWAPKGPAMLIRIKAGADAQGNITAWDHEYWTGPHVSRYGKQGKSVAIGAWYLEKPATPFFIQGAGSDVVARAVAGADTFYGFPNRHVVEHVTELFSPLRSGELRGVAGLPHAFAVQSMLDELAAKAAIDPVEFRLRFIKDARMRAVIEAAAKAAGWTRGAAPSGKGRGLSTFYYDRPFARAACVAEVEADKTSGRVKVKRVVAAFDVGQIVNPDGVRNQLEGGIIQTLSRTMVEEVTYAGGKVTSLDWGSYPMMGLMDLPEVEIVLIDRPTERSGGAGETSVPIIPGAIANAIYDAIGVRVRDMPFTPERVRAALAG
jgi:CO/xanthine dehydrogenase Mo-binding subunit